MDKEIDLLKEKLARACRMLEMMGLIDHSGHISGRMPGSQTFFIHPQQLSRAEVTPGDMAEVTLKGDWVGGKMNPPSESPIHAAVYQARQDVNCVVHVHTHYSILPSIVGVDLVPVCQHGAIFGAVVPVYGDSEKIDDFEKASGLARALGKSRAVIMKGARRGDRGVGGGSRVCGLVSPGRECQALRSGIHPGQAPSSP